MEQTNKELLAKAKERFKSETALDPWVKSFRKKLKNGTATMTDVEAYAVRISRYASTATSAVLGEGVDWATTNKIMTPILKDINSMVTEANASVIKAARKAKKIGLAPVKPRFNGKDGDSVLARVSSVSAKGGEEAVIDKAIKQASEWFALASQGESLRMNAKQEYDAGLAPKLKRLEADKCCPWCASMAGEYDYKDAPTGIYRRHANCRCSIIYEPSRGRHEAVDKGK